VRKMVKLFVESKLTFSFVEGDLMGAIISGVPMGSKKLHLSHLSLWAKS